MKPNNATILTFVAIVAVFPPLVAAQDICSAIAHVVNAGRSDMPPLVSLKTYTLPAPDAYCSTRKLRKWKDRNKEGYDDGRGTFWCFWPLPDGLGLPEQRSRVKNFVDAINTCMKNRSVPGDWGRWGDEDIVDEGTGAVTGEKWRVTWRWNSKSIYDSASGEFADSGSGRMHMFVYNGRRNSDPNSQIGIRFRVYSTRTNVLVD